MPNLSTEQIRQHIGAQVRIARTRVQPKMSQTALGNVLGVTFQQIQKYEIGKDRIAAESLVLIAEATGQGLPFFFETALEACSSPAPAHIDVVELEGEAA